MPIYLGALPRPLEHSADDIEDRVILEHRFEVHAGACWRVTRRKALQPDVAPGHANAECGKEAEHTRVQIPDAATGVVKRCGEERQSDADHGDSLEDAQRTGLEHHRVLRIERKRHHAGASNKTEGIYYSLSK